MPISGKVLRKEFEEKGWIFKRQTGSHAILERNGVHVSIPMHTELATGTEHSLRKVLNKE